MSYSGVLRVAPPITYRVVTPSYIRCTTSPSAACGRLWQWSVQMPGLSADERDVVRLAVGHVQRVHPPRAAAGRHPVAGEHHRVVAVQVHRVHVAAVVADPHADHVAVGHHEHRRVRVLPAVDRPPHAGPAVQEPGPAADVVPEACAARPPGRSPAAPACRSERVERRRRLARRRRGRSRAPPRSARPGARGPRTRRPASSPPGRRGRPRSPAPPASRDRGRRRRTSVPSIATSAYGAPATHTDIGPLSVLTTRIRARVARRRRHRQVALAAVDGAQPRRRGGPARPHPHRTVSRRRRCRRPRPVRRAGRGSPGCATSGGSGTSTCRRGRRRTGRRGRGRAAPRPG